MRNILLIFSVLFFLSLPIFSQITSSSASGRSNSKSETDHDREARLKQITSDAGRYFKQGLLNLIDNRRSGTAENFNKAVEVFLMSGINLTLEDNLKARNCYDQLIETIYRIEFPTDAQIPQIRGLSATCSWNIDNKLADDIATLLRPSINKQNPAMGNIVTASAVNGIPSDEPQIGFNEQKFVSSPTDTLATIDLEAEERKARQSRQKVQLVTWSDISKRTGVSVEALMAVNPGMVVPRGKILVPVIKTLNVSNPVSVSTPKAPIVTKKSELLSSANKPPVKIVKAQAGDTVAKVAQRYGANATEIAKFNGLLPTSVLSAGRNIKIPLKGYIYSKPILPKIPLSVGDNSAAGPKPIPSKDGKLEAVLNYFNENLHDPYSVRYVSWSAVKRDIYSYQDCWSVVVKYRAKNTFGAYVLTEVIYYIRNNKVIGYEKL